MRRIEIDDFVQPLGARVGQALLRVVLGLVALAHAAQRLLQLREVEGDLTELGVRGAPQIVMAVLAITALAGLGLLLGRFTRTAAFLVLCDALAGAGLIAVQQRFWSRLVELQLLGLLAGVALFFVLAGSHAFSADALLRRRARDRAIVRDEIWQRPPYVSGNAASVDDTLELAPHRLESRGPERRRLFGRH
jgi:uncharacterized membrane protein YphA (DoxX/SURF4 family)